MTKLTQKNFDYFKSRCLHWQKEFGMTEWILRFRWDEKDEESIAKCSINFSSRNATMNLCRNWRIELSEKELEKTAFHEIQEIMLNDIRSDAIEMGLSEDHLNRLVHQVIHRWENYVFKP